MIKFFLFLLLGVYIIRTLFTGLFRYFIRNLSQQQKASPKPSNENPKKGPDSKNVGEYIEYEEID